ncbi:MAG: hypothetical protein P8166_02980 [Candidatus Thiodiazotropha sp.]
MRFKKLAILITVVFSMSFLTGFSFKDVSDKIKPDTDKCEDKNHETACKNTERLKAAAKVIAIGVAAKVIYDMIVDYNSKKVLDDSQVSKLYLIKNNKLPDEPTVVSYEASLTPSNVAQVGKKVQVKTSITVVPSKKSAQALIEEKIEIFDNEDNSKVIKSLVKSVNGETKSVGSYENQFTFTLPQGMPQGVYPIRTAVIVDGKEQPAKPNTMQVVMHVFENAQYQFAYLAK